MENKHQAFKKTHPFQQVIKATVLSLSTISLLAGIIAPMVVIMGILIYFSWLFFGYPFFSWTLYYLIVNSYPIWLKILIYSVEIMVFLVGLGLLFTALINFTKHKKRTKTTNSTNIVSNGIYRFIRHPQNLGISLMLIPFAVILPFGLTKEMIRYGDILSLGLSCFFLTLISLHEEKVMLKTYPEAYWAYIQKTRFYLPFKKGSSKLLEYSSEITNKYLKKTFVKLLFCYIGFFLGALGLFYILKPFMVRIRFPPVYETHIPIDEIIEYFSYWKVSLIPFIVLISIWILSLIIVLRKYLLSKKLASNTQK